MDPLVSQRGGFRPKFLSDLGPLWLCESLGVCCPLKFHSDDPRQDQVFPFPGVNGQMTADPSGISARTIQSTVDP